MNGTTKTEKLQPHGKHIPRRQCIPILYTKGTHYDVGFDVVILFIFLSSIYSDQNIKNSLKKTLKILMLLTNFK